MGGAGGQKEKEGRAAKYTWVGRRGILLSPLFRSSIRKGKMGKDMKSGKGGGKRIENARRQGSLCEGKKPRGLAPRGEALLCCRSKRLKRRQKQREKEKKKETAATSAKVKKHERARQKKGEEKKERILAPRKI